MRCFTESTHEVRGLRSSMDRSRLSLSSTPLSSKVSEAQEKEEVLVGVAVAVVEESYTLQLCQGDASCGRC